MHTGIIQTALLKTLPLELEYAEPALSFELDAAPAGQVEYSDSYVAEFYQLLRAI